MEGLDAMQHPGIVYRDGPTGRPAALAVGPDVWEVASALRYTSGSDEERVAALADQFSVHVRHIRIAIDFAAAHREEMAAQVSANGTAPRTAMALCAADQGALAWTSADVAGSTTASASL